MKEKLGTLWLNGSQNTKPERNLSFEELCNIIKNGDLKIKEIIYHIRSMKERGVSKSIIDDYKNALPYVNMLGTYTYRNDESFDENSFNWIMAWDIDKKDNPTKDFNELRSIICDTESTVMCATTPSGGLRGFTKLEENAFTFNKTEYHDIIKECVHPRLVLRWKGVKLDAHQYTLSQPWFIPYDTDVYANWNAKALKVIYTRFSVRPKNTYKPIFVDDLQSEFFEALSTINQDLRYNDVLKLCSYAKRIRCSYEDLMYNIKHKIYSDSSASNENVLRKTFRTAKEDAMSKATINFLIKGLGGIPMKY